MPQPLPSGTATVRITTPTTLSWTAAQLASVFPAPPPDLSALFGQGGFFAYGQPGYGVSPVVIARTPYPRFGPEWIAKNEPDAPWYRLLDAVRGDTPDGFVNAVALHYVPGNGRTNYPPGVLTMERLSANGWEGPNVSTILAKDDPRSATYGGTSGIVIPSFDDGRIAVGTGLDVPLPQPGTPEAEAITQDDIIALIEEGTPLPVPTPAPTPAATPITESLTPVIEPMPASLPVPSLPSVPVVPSGSGNLLIDIPDVFDPIVPVPITRGPLVPAPGPASPTVTAAQTGTTNGWLIGGAVALGALLLAGGGKRRR